MMGAFEWNSVCMCVCGGGGHSIHLHRRSYSQLVEICSSVLMVRTKSMKSRDEIKPPNALCVIHLTTERSCPKKTNQNDIDLAWKHILHLCPCKLQAVLVDCYFLFYLQLKKFKHTWIKYKGTSSKERRDSKADFEAVRHLGPLHHVLSVNHPRLWFVNFHPVDLTTIKRFLASFTPRMYTDPVFCEWTYPNALVEADECMEQTLAQTTVGLQHTVRVWILYFRYTSGRLGWFWADETSDTADEPVFWLADLVIDRGMVSPVACCLMVIQMQTMKAVAGKHLSLEVQLRLARCPSLL